ncbi:SCP-like extracellular [Streptomyces sp. CB00455]|uniref:CAP domain-containing protein n=1 Tax=Streptomyces sp. CB00455 TaxID=1703927 RepID=UPI0009680AEA|nr:CAP domain-containing protein [Streptomyces sp. CB00455]OKK20417.1 SCP-like extracellular [Streptomyces sp. CB00455]
MGRHGLHAAPRRGGKRSTALRAGLLGVSVAVALGTAAVTTGMVPVGDSFPYVGISAPDTADESEALAKAPSDPGGAAERQGGLANLSGRAPAGAGTGSPSGSPSASPSPSASLSASPSPSASASPTPSAPPSSSAPPSAPASPSAPPAAAPTTKAPPKIAAPAPVKPAPVKPAPVKPAPMKPAPVKPAPPKPAPKPPVAPPPVAPPPAGDGHSAEEAAVVTLVNQARAQAGCGPVRANPPLAALAGAFSKDMATRGFFDHTDPDGNTPWDRAAQAGLSGLGGENIARGQGDAVSVMNSWMNSPGHKANILNCEFRTLGVGAHFAAGGPWWTQDFGF